jgi:hypothetical protein
VTEDGSAVGWHAATGDCERVRPGLIGQPVNTVTSAAYLVGAAWIARRPTPRRLLWATALTWVGAGSIAYHGPGTRAGQQLHDSSLVALGLVAATGQRRPNRHRLVAAPIAAGAAVVHAATRTGRRRCRPDSLLQGHGLWHLLSALSATLIATGEEPR